MFDNLSALGYGIVTFSIIIGVGTIVLYNFGGSTGCSQNADFPTWNATAGKCQNSSGSQVDPSGTSYTNINYLTGQLGTSGLAGWTPAIIAFSVGMLFLGAFFIGKGRKY